MLLALAAFDVVVTTPGWPYAALLGVPVLVAVALTRADLHRRAALAVGALAVSLAGTAALALADYRYLGTFGLAESAALLLLVTSLWRRAAGPRDWVLVGCAAVAVVAQSLRTITIDTPTYATLLALAAVVAAAVGTALRSADLQHQLAVAAVRRAEREEIARELHDVVAHHVTGIIVTAQATRWVAGTTGSPVPPALSSALASIEASGTDALASMRRLVEVLRTADPTGAPRTRTPELGDLAELVDRFGATGAVGAAELVLEGVDDGERLPTELHAAVYRVVQESLTNVQRHARGAARVRVAVTRSSTGVEVLVVNSPGRAGQPAAAPAGGGFGVVGLHERVAALGGTLRLGPQDDGGWSVQAHLPTAAPTADPGAPTTSAAPGPGPGARMAP